MPMVKVPAPMHRCGAGRRPFPQGAVKKMG